MVSGDSRIAVALVADACQADVEGRVVLTAVRDDAGTIVDMECLEATAAACAMLGRRREELVGRRWLDVFPEALWNGCLDEYRSVVETGRPSLCRRSLMTLGSSAGERYVDARVVKVGDGVSHAFLDVTEPAAADSLPEESNSILKALTQDSREVVLRLALDGRVTYCSPSVAGVLGLEQDDVIGEDYGTLLHPDDPGVGAPGNGSGTRDAAGRALQVRHGDGSSRWIEPSTQPILAADGSPVGYLAIWRDVSGRVEADQRATIAEAQLRSLTDNIQDAILMADDQCVITYCSPSVTRLLEWSPEELLGLPSNALMHPDDFAAIVANPPAPSGPRGETICTARLRTKSGSYRWIESANRSVLSPDAEVLGYTATWRDAQARVEAEEQLLHRAKVDTLTGLANRPEILDIVGRIADQTDRVERAVAVLFCDIDLFKDINDQYGHPAGDEVLREISTRISATIRQGDRAGRMGGDEILVILHGIHSLSAAEAAAEKIREAASQRIDLDDGAWVEPTLSVGATILYPGESVHDLIARADSAMYAAKKSGRDRVIAVGSPPPVSCTQPGNFT